MAQKVFPTEMVSHEEQTRMDSLMEAIVNTMIGFGLAVATNAVVLPMMLGVPVSATDSAVIALIFTATSVARSYVLRRAFNGRSVWQAIKSISPHLVNLSFWAWLISRSVDLRETHAKQHACYYRESPHEPYNSPCTKV